MSAIGIRRLAIAAGLAASAPTSALAADISFPDDGLIARAVLPYTPLLFDLAVQGGRSVAKITYDRRGYDPVTNTFFVSGLHVKRDTADVKIGRLRTDMGSVLIEDISIDTRGLDLRPELREGLRRLGRERIEGDVLMSFRSNPSRAAYDVAMRYDFADIGSLSLTATLDDFHVLMPLSDLEYGQLSGEPAVAGELVKASIAYEDHGLMPTAIDMWAEQAGVTPDQMKAGLLTAPSQFAAQLAGGLPGGVSPALKDRVFAWARIAEEFLKEEDAIRVTLAPTEPVPLERLQSGVVDEALIAALNPSVTRGFDQPLIGPPPAGAIGQAQALISGAGAPQDREAGARSLLALAAFGDLAAVRSIAATFGDAPPPDLAPDELAALYGYLLVARALDGGVADPALAALTAKLSPDSALAAEREAGRYFSAHAPADPGRRTITAETVGDYDANALRGAAYDYYEGYGVPRDFTRALTLALVASAAGDPFAVTLRDELTTAAQRKEIVLGAADARAEAARLWTAYLAAHPGGR